MKMVKETIENGIDFAILFSRCICLDVAKVRSIVHPNISWQRV